MTQLPNLDILTPTPQAPTDTARTDPQEHVRMPVPVPAVPPFPKAHRTYSYHDGAKTPCTCTIGYDFASGVEMVEVSDDDADDEDSSSEEMDTDDEDKSDRVHHSPNAPSHPQEGSQDTNFRVHSGTFGAHPPQFFQGATNFQITGRPTFNVIEGDAHFINVAPTSARNGNGHVNSRASHQHVPFNGNPTSSKTDWRSGPNNKTFGQESQPTNWRAQRQSFANMDSNAGPSNPCRGDGEDIPKASHGNNIHNYNAFAPYGGDRFGNGASRFAMSKASFITKNGVIIKCDPGVLQPRRK